MAQAYTSPDWSSGEGISPSNLQSISNVLENIVQGTDKAIHNFSINGQNATVTFVDGSIETFAITGTKGIVEVTKSTSGNTDTYTIHFTDGTTYSFEVTNGGGGGNADKVELTKAEYDALPDSKLTDGKMYFINDWSQGGSNIEDISNLLTLVNTTSANKTAYRWNKLINIIGRFDNTVIFNTGNNKIGHFDGPLPKKSTIVPVVCVKYGVVTPNPLIGSIRINSSGFEDGDITVYCPEQFPAGSQFQINVMYFTED